MKWLDDLQADMWGFLSTSLAMTWMTVVRSVKIWHWTLPVGRFAGILAGLCLSTSALPNGLHLDPSPCLYLSDTRIYRSYMSLESSNYEHEREDARRVRNFRHFYPDDKLLLFALEDQTNYFYPEHVPIRHYSLLLDQNCGRHCISTLIYTQNDQIYFLEVIHSGLIYKASYAEEIQGMILRGMEAFFLTLDRKSLVRIYGLANQNTLTLQNMRPYFAIPVTNVEIIPLERFVHPNRDVVLRCTDPDASQRR